MDYDDEQVLDVQKKEENDFLFFGDLVFAGVLEKNTLSRTDEDGTAWRTVSFKPAPDFFQAYNLRRSDFPGNLITKEYKEELIFIDGFTDPNLGRRHLIACDYFGGENTMIMKINRGAFSELLRLRKESQKYKLMFLSKDKESKRLMLGMRETAKEISDINKLLRLREDRDEDRERERKKATDNI